MKISSQGQFKMHKSRQRVSAFYNSATATLGTFPGIAGATVNYMDFTIAAVEDYTKCVVSMCGGKVTDNNYAAVAELTSNTNLRLWVGQGTVNITVNVDIYEFLDIFTVEKFLIGLDEGVATGSSAVALDAAREQLVFSGGVFIQSASFFGGKIPTIWVDEGAGLVRCERNNSLSSRAGAGLYLVTAPSAL